MTSLSREGLTIDVVARFISRRVLNPLVAPTIAAVIATSQRPAVQHLIQVLLGRFPWAKHTLDSLAIRFPWYRQAVYTAAAASLLLWGNRYLNKWSRNNWTQDPTWDLDKEIVLVTGGAGGIGQSLIKQLLARHPKTTIIVVDYVKLSWTPPPGSRVHYYQCDLSNAAMLKDTAARIRAEVGHPTVLVNNAGLCRGRTILEGSYNDVELTVRTNLIAPMLLIKEFLPHMVEKDHGHIINVGSMASVLPAACIADYAATKAGLTAMTESLQLELKYRHNAARVRTSLCIFSFIQTPLFKGETGLSHFWQPLVHADTAGEWLANIIASGYGQTLYLPGMARYLSMVRGGPEWLFGVVHGGSENFAVIFDQPTQKLDENTGYLKGE